jgi:hypothetical protein
MSARLYPSLAAALALAMPQPVMIGAQSIGGMMCGDRASAIRVVIPVKRRKGEEGDGCAKACHLSCDRRVKRREA